MPSKLGPHSLSSRDELSQFVANGGRLVKLVSDFPVESLVAINPDILIIGRAYDPLTAQEQYDAGLSPQKAAEQWVAMQETIYRRHPQIKYWEGHNEPSWGAPQDTNAVRKMRWYGETEAARVELLAKMSLKAVVGNFATGYPEIQHDNTLWEAFLPALQAAHRHQGMLGVHEYGGPFMWSLYGPYVKDNCGSTPLPEPDNSEGWLCLRYRKVHRFILKPNGLANLPIVITENGTDRVGTFCEPFISGAWHDLIDAWKGWNGSTDPIDYWRGQERDPERYYAEQLIWYDREMQKDPYCVGSCIFTLGNFGPPWNDFEISGTRAVAHLLDHIKRDPWQGPRDPWAAGGTSTSLSPGSPKTVAQPVQPTPTTPPGATTTPGDIIITDPGAALIAAYNSRNPDSALTLYNNNAVVVTPRRTAAGNINIRRLYRDAFAANPSLQASLLKSENKSTHWLIEWTDGQRTLKDTVLLHQGKIQRHDSSLKV